MLEFKRKQMTAIGEEQFRCNLADFLRRHFEGMASLQLSQLDSELDEIIAQCRKSGLKSQRAVAAYALACALFGNARVAGDPSIITVLADRRSPQIDRALLIEMWTAAAYSDYRRAQGG
jgi:hypothetical protein